MKRHEQQRGKQPGRWQGGFLGFRAATGSAAALLVSACLSTVASGQQLRPEHVLVIYDSRISDSVLVAEHYAGSASVPGGTGGRAGTRPGVRVFDLASAGLAPANTPTIDRSVFNANIRQPIRNWLTTNDASGAIRCLVMTKGIAHRVENVLNAGTGDNPGSVGTVYGNGNYNAAAVDSELALLWQNLEVGENGGNADSKLDGYILNPYWKQSLPITAWTTTNRQVQKNFTTPVTVPASGVGEMWSALQTDPKQPVSSTQFGPGDLYLVSRLDGNTVAQVRAMLDRSINSTAGASGGIVVNVNTVGFVLDESGSDSSQSAINNGELDNAGYNLTWNGDDYEQTRDGLLTDRRFNPSNIKYDAVANASRFIVGSLLSYGGQGLIIDSVATPLPILLLASYGSNHSGTFPGDGVSGSPNARTTYASSFTYAPGAVFNSLESYNGRQFGGIGAPPVAQQQAADFIAAGGTFAVCNVYEPFTITIADNALLARNFLYGNLTWGEAAMSSLPVISFQQMAIGDPLARLARSSEDRDGDGRVTIDDLYLWSAAPVDLNRNNTVNEADRKIMEDAVRSTRNGEMRGSQR